MTDESCGLNIICNYDKSRFFDEVDDGICNKLATKYFVYKIPSRLFVPQYIARCDSHPIKEGMKVYLSLASKETYIIAQISES